MSCRSKERHTLCIRHACLHIEVADTPEKRLKGLMFRESLSRKEGMLFVFKESARHAFWMKNMRFPIDIIWIDSGRRVVDVTVGAQPCSAACPSIRPKADAQYVLEAYYGFAGDNKIGRGDEARF